MPGGTEHERALGYMPALDGLRAIAVVAVLLYHGEVSWIPGGYLGVDAFFVLSGFLITSLLLREWTRTGRIDLKAFWTRRARRLLPALALVLAAVAVYAAVAASPLEMRQLRSDALATLGYLANWSQIFSDQSYFEQLGAPSPLRHAWSLAIEEQFYLLWPLVVLGVLTVGRGSRRPLMVVSIVLASGSAVLMAVLSRNADDPSRVYYGTDTRMQSLLVGVMLALVLTRGEAVSSARRRAALHTVAVGAAVVLAVVWTTTSEDDAWMYRGGYLLVASLVAVVIAAATQRHGAGPLGALLSVPPLRAIGIISYGLYLWHWPIYVYLTPERTGAEGGALLALRLGVTCAAATASYYVVEHPIRRGALRGWSMRVLAPATAGALVVALVVTTAPPGPRPFVEVSAADVRPPPVQREIAAAPARPEPKRVMLVGDSIATSMAPGLARAATGGGFQFWDASVAGCGLAQDVGERWLAYWQPNSPTCVPGWRERWPPQIAEFDPHVVVALFGAQDAFDRRVDGRVIRFDTPDGAVLAQSELDQAVDMLSAGGADVVLLTTPYNRICCPMRIELERSPMNEAWVDMYNHAQLDVARQNAPRVVVLDLNRALNPGGTWTDTVDGIKVRSFDRSHLSPEGADFVARWLVPLLPGVEVDASGDDDLVAAAGPDRTAAVSESPAQPAFRR